MPVMLPDTCPLCSCHMTKHNVEDDYLYSCKLCGCIFTYVPERDYLTVVKDKNAYYGIGHQLWLTPASKLQLSHEPPPEADLICTICNHARRFHIEYGSSTECHVVTDRLDCSCARFTDPRQPTETLVSKWDNVYFYAEAPLSDPINHPKHYTSHPSGVECIQITEHMSFCLGNAIKYIWRFDQKNGLEDLKKAQWYLNREIERLEDH